MRSASCGGSRALVAHLHHGSLPLAAGAHLDPALARVAQRVLEQVDERLLTSTASTATSGRSGRRASRCPARRLALDAGDRRADQLLERGPLRLGSSVPDSSRVMSSRFRPAGSVGRLVEHGGRELAATAVAGGGCSSNALAAPVIAASGVRRSCDTSSGACCAAAASAVTRARSAPPRAAPARAERRSGARARSPRRAARGEGRTGAGSSRASTPSRERLPSIGS